jgi:AraC-like DNA-binding protein
MTDAQLSEVDRHAPPLIGTPEFNTAFLHRWNAGLPATDLQQQHLVQAIALMLDRPFDALTVGKLAAAAGMSESSFARLFRNRFGQPPIDFLKTERLRYASHLLRTTPLPVKTVAMRAGYSSRSYFSRAFQEAFGVAPTAIRRENRVVLSLPEGERERISAVRRYDLFDAQPAGGFDRIIALAARRYDVPIAAISVVDHERIRFRARHGMMPVHTAREPGLCGSAITSPEPWILTDARQDARACTNRLVTGDPGVRFYAGVQLRTPTGHGLGALCIMDRKARAIEPRQLDDLRDLAAIVMDQLQARLVPRI